MFVVLDDADLEKAVKIGVQARLTNAGQAMYGGEALYLYARKSPIEFLSQFTEAFRKVKVGDGRASTELGPALSSKMLWIH